MTTTTLAELFTKLNFYKDIDKQDDLYKVIALDDALNEFRRDNRLPWTIQKSTLKLFKNILYYEPDSSHDSLINLNRNEVDGFSEALSYFNTDINQFIEMTKRQRNLLTQLYIDGNKALGVRNIEQEIFNVVLDNAGDEDTYAAVSNATEIGENTVYTLDDNNSISYDIIGTATIKNTYETAVDDEDYLEKYYIRRIYLKAVPTSIELRSQTNDSNYIKATLTEQVTGLPFIANDWNYIGFAYEDGTEVGTFDSSDIASSKIIITGYTGIMYISYDSIDEFLLQQYWFYSKFAVMSSAATTPDKVEFLNYESNNYDITDSLVGPTKWIDPIVKKAREQLVLGIENEVVRKGIAKRSERATAQFDRNFPNQEPKLTTVTRRFNDNPEEMNYVP